MNTTFLKRLAAGLGICTAATLQANNIQVTNTTLTDNTGTTAKVQFDISWENSWRGGGVANWDAAWVFVKYKMSNGVWNHARLENAGHTAPGGSILDPGLLAPGTAYHATTNPVIGTFLRRDADGSGTFTANGVQLLWDYMAHGIMAYNDIVAVQVFAIEMVYVNEGPFYLGSGGTGFFQFSTYNGSGAFLVSSAGGITISNSTPGSLWATGLQSGSSVGGAFPNGYGASYCMKYELSQQQYVDFLNSLSREQQGNRTGAVIPTTATSITNHYVMSNSTGVISRNGIRCNSTFPAQLPIGFYCDGNGNGTGGEADDGQWVACNYLTWAHLAAYLDWSGLRPMTELEYEKICRGFIPPVLGEHAWGSAQVNSAGPGLTNGGAANEGIAANYSTTIGNLLGPGSDGPHRVGIFAGHPSNTGRVTSGAGYFGAMELSGNVFERAVTVAISEGRSFTAKHGDGVLDASGGHVISNADWPAASGLGIGCRGGAISDGGQTSDRTYANTASSFNGVEGGRGVRTAL